MESALDGAAGSEVGTLEAELTKERQARAALEAELERERESRSSETKALMVEREEWARERDELERGIRERVAVASQKSAKLARYLAELQAETTRGDHRS